MNRNKNLFYLNSDINIARKDYRNIYLLPCNTSTNALSKWYIPKFLSHLQLSGIASYIFETNSSMLVTWVGKKSSLDQSELDKRRGGCAGHWGNSRWGIRVRLLSFSLSNPKEVLQPRPQSILFFLIMADDENAPSPRYWVVFYTIRIII